MKDITAIIPAAGLGLRLRRKIPKALVVPIPLPDDDFIKRVKQLKKLAKTPKGFTPEVKRKGKWVALGKFKTAKKAAAIGKKKALNTAAASVRLRQNGKIIPLKPSKLFRVAKGGKGVIVQKKTKRIRTPGEKKEISLIGSRAAKAKRVKKLSIVKPKKKKAKRKTKPKKGSKKK